MHRHHVQGPESKDIIETAHVTSVASFYKTTRIPFLCVQGKQK